MILMMGSLTTGTVNLSRPREELFTPASRLVIVWVETTFATSSAAFISQPQPTQPQPQPQPQPPPPAAEHLIQVPTAAAHRGRVPPAAARDRVPPAVAHRGRVPPAVAHSN